MSSFLRLQFQNLSPYFWGFFALSCIAIPLFTFLSQHSTLNIFAAFFGVCYAFFAGSKKAICFVFGICYSVLTIFIAYEIQLYGEMMINCLYLPINLVGFYLWNKNQNPEKTQTTIRNLPFKKTFIYLFFSIFTSLVLGFILDSKNAAFPFLNAFTFILQILAFYLQIRRYIQNYFFVTLANIFNLYIWLDFTLLDSKYIFQLLNALIFFFIGIYYYIQWNKDIKQ